MKSFQNKWPFKNGKSPELKTLNVLASKGLGPVWHFNINFWLFLAILAALAIYILFSFFLVAQFFGDRQQKDLLTKLEKDFHATQKALYQAKQRLKFLEDYIDPSKIPTEGTKVAGSAESLTAQDKASIVRNDEFSKGPGPGTENAVFTIKDMDMNMGGSSLSVSFKLARTAPGGSPARGYVFIIAVDRSTDPPRVWPSPKAEMENGMPANPKKGQAYKIRNFRRIRTRWNFKSSDSIPSEIRIVVYDRSGGLLLNEKYHIKKKP